MTQGHKTSVHFKVVNNIDVQLFKKYTKQKNCTLKTEYMRMFPDVRLDIVPTNILKLYQKEIIYYDEFIS